MPSKASKISIFPRWSVSYRGFFSVKWRSTIARAALVHFEIAANRLFNRVCGVDAPAVVGPISRRLGLRESVGRWNNRLNYRTAAGGEKEPSWLFLTKVCSSF